MQWNNNLLFLSRNATHARTCITFKVTFLVFRYFISCLNTAGFLSLTSCFHKAVKSTLRKTRIFFFFFWFSLFSAKTNRDMYVGQYMNHNIPCFLHRKQATPSALPLNYSINNNPWKDCWMAPSSAGLVTPINNELPTNSVLVWCTLHTTQAS